MYEVCDNWKQIGVRHADFRSGPPPAGVGAAGGAARAPVPACLADPRARLTLHYSPLSHSSRTQTLDISKCTWCKHSR